MAKRPRTGTRTKDEQRPVHPPASLEELSLDVRVLAAETADLREAWTHDHDPQTRRSSKFTGPRYHTLLKRIGHAFERMVAAGILPDSDQILEKMKARPASWWPVKEHMEHLLGLVCSAVCRSAPTSVPATGSRWQRCLQDPNVLEVLLPDEQLDCLAWVLGQCLEKLMTAVTVPTSDPEWVSYSIAAKELEYTEAHVSRLAKKLNARRKHQGRYQIDLVKAKQHEKINKARNDARKDSRFEKEQAAKHAAAGAKRAHLS